jgi:hypothetical protein
MSIYFTATDRSPYTYLIIHKNTGNRYYGCRYAKNCQPEELWLDYFTSSKIIKNIIKREGKDAFAFEVRKIFDDVKKCRAFEAKLLRRIRAGSRDDWYNQHDGSEKFMCSGHTDITKKKIGKSSLKRGARPPVTIKKCPHCLVEVNAASYAQWHGDYCVQNKTASAKEYIADSSETRKKKSLAKLSHPKKHCMHCNKCIEPCHYGNFHGDYCKKNNTSTRKFNPPRPKTKCKYCGKEVSNNTLNRLHNENCPSLRNVQQMIYNY